MTTLLVPDSLAEALTALGEHPGATVVAGATSVVAQLTFGEADPQVLVSLGRVEELHQCEVAKTELRIGAMVSFSRLMDGSVASLAPGLADVARSLGSAQLRNQVTIGGNVAVGYGDVVPMLLALDASLDVVSGDGPATIPLSKFVERREILGALITHVVVPVVEGRQEFVKVGRRAAFSSTLVSCATAFDAARDHFRIALGGVGAQPIRDPAAERRLAARVDWRSHAAEPGAVDALVEEMLSGADGLDRWHSTAAYRRHAAAVLVRRAVAGVLDDLPS